MKLQYLDFEQPIAELEGKVEELKELNQPGIQEDIKRLENKARKELQRLYSKLTAWQTVQVARHPQRPYTLDYVHALFTDVEVLAGDRAYADDAAIVGGLARFQGQAILWIGQQKGRDTKEKIQRNFGMPRPEGYRKALRLMRLAERFRLPVLTFIDTPGAYPGIGAEERGQSEAIARNLAVMSDLAVPIISLVIGEGGSGGALAIGVGDRLLMLEYSVYSVISPEGCASILWKDAAKAAEAAETLGITARRLQSLGLVDEVIDEPLGGAHRNVQLVYENIAASLARHLQELQGMETARLLSHRYERLMHYGVVGAA
ncbi:acetyl-CoA carboxylase carboxyltransferase subunit alpha [Acidithiobacillus sp. CV18-2]|uniref:Acetyl-coenzyme A carboxylase carboxyl transferase subunit alpha n=1 Tax=Igneacidithiobacillus copahuensis TaxID=2724909 RepID=A0AAE2YQI3_9PROT|nr:acetyl-CoA carboxylase carboxyltransferase subunit alpha [Acidithiobacillus sp. CV18-3]MBU2757130.1 acetyl-CoA carboxylase carboxyltransferase subunit alpha [Acidithiobacillus sp. BN09-2]MBU2776006.1 acetyl-CoA carboxylase carboxyltransferase subunit alpha [Acidithiobacillus sp. CV18-2]MBU2788519.1 acetyl-CoA carboxylase carboxyltransferase subunit alpha [Igneacidithiobacillus copahuensis]MBU2795897.1 acetyl-CoA carboxylase carboxyltransferase subunit alpha [Acidithiobacillus sp. VAN18-2]MB